MRTCMVPTPVIGQGICNILRLTRYSISVFLVLCRFRRGKYLEAIEDFEEVIRTSEDPKQKKDVRCVLSLHAQNFPGHPYVSVLRC